MALKQINLFGSSTKSISNFISAQTRVNCFFDIVDDSEKDSRIILRGTPGQRYVTTIPETEIRGRKVANNTLYIVAGNYLYALGADMTYNIKATIGGGNSGRVAMATNGNQILILTGGQGYIFDILADTLTAITAEAFPQKANFCTFLNGYFVVNEPDTPNFYSSAFYDGTQWAALDFDVASASPDNLTTVTSFRGTLILGGPDSLEFWSPATTGSETFTPLGQTVQDWGVAAPYSMINIAGTIAWVATNAAGQVQIMAMNGYSPVAISDAGIENIINRFDIVSDAYSSSYSLDGHAFLEITFPNAGRSFLYDFKTAAWSTPQYGTGPTGVSNIAGTVTYNNKVYAWGSGSGDIFELTFDVNTHNGNAIKRQITSKHIEIGGDQFVVDELWFDMEVGNGTISGQGVDPKVMVEISKDNGSTFPIYKEIKLGKMGAYKTRVIWRRLGIARDMVVRITMTDPVPFVIIRGCAAISVG